MKDATTFNVNKHNAVQYKITDGVSTIVIFDTRHIIGHKTVLALAAQGLNVNDFVDDHGNPKKLLLDAVKEMAIKLKEDSKPTSKKRKNL